MKGYVGVRFVLTLKMGHKGREVEKHWFRQFAPIIGEPLTASTPYEPRSDAVTRRQRPEQVVKQQCTRTEHVLGQRRPRRQIRAVQSCKQVRIRQQGVG